MRDNGMLTAAEIRMLLAEETDVDPEKRTEKSGDNDSRTDEELEEDDFDADAFRKRCEEIIPHFMVFLAGDDELPVTDTPEKLKIWADVLDEYDKKNTEYVEGAGGMTAI